jgi:hypothetical protein
MIVLYVEQGYLDNFKDEQEFWYVSKDADESEKCDAPRDGDKWWIPTVRVPPQGLSDHSRKLLQHQKDLVGQVHKAAMAMNADVLTEMEIPEEYFESLPKVIHNNSPAICLKTSMIVDHPEKDHCPTTLSSSLP